MRWQIIGPNNTRHRPAPPSQGMVQRAHHTAASALWRIDALLAAAAAAKRAGSWNPDHATTAADHGDLATADHILGKRR